MQHTASNAVLVFETVEFDVVDIHNVPWLRGPQIAGALGYNRDDRLADLYARNADEFTDEMTELLELDTAGGRQQVRIFSPRGCYLLGMLARTDRAKTFRAWVLDVLEGRLVPQQTGRLTVSQRLSALRYRGLLAKDLSRTTERGVALELYANLRHVSRLLGMSTTDLDTLAPGLKQQSLGN
ncbi:MULTISPECIES: BRO-N domain-containing protein [pseudomallei group]|uniref:BRO-N domain-containing protein n=1 Tax=pseudomallei group TaxID=111527 RepID=UPI00037687FD|nr:MULTISPECIES: Bro-N domain-containing protein [pseudomallei group]ARM00523.1 transcriptional regulator [Burkholderia pseudomallei]MCS3399904.1 Bro-N domain-containing protein [Burkholderia thailandensis]MCS6428836.1 Bro-N domain-containing protein [Burkholderia thailandensis]MCS6451551.1 Bro-N domain-containing protein [Burkholderia thailandensis]MCS6467863.1 Bro-N domain-containing protein [Burkholderia thailandensis]